MILEWIETLGEGILEKEIDANVLSAFPPQIRRAIIAEVTNCIYQSCSGSPIGGGANASSASGNLMSSMTSMFHVQWVTEIIGQAFTLPLEDMNIVSNAAVVYIQWLVEADRRPPVIQLGNDKVRQEFTQTLLKHLSLLFAPKRLEASSGTAKALQSTVASKHVELCKLVLRTISQSISASSSTNSPLVSVDKTPAENEKIICLSQHTWEVLLYIMLGITDSLLHRPSQPYCYLAEELEEPLLMTLMEFWLRSGLQVTSLWNCIRRLYPTWTHRPFVVSMWANSVLALTQRVADILYSPSVGSSNLNYTINSSLFSINVNDEFAVFAWHQMTHLIGPAYSLSPAVFYRAVLGMDRIVNVFLTISSDEVEECKGQSGKAKIAKKKMPGTNTIMHIYGRWLFNAANRKSPDCVEGRAQAYAVLCRIIVRAQIGGNAGPINHIYLHQLYSALVDGLSGDPLSLVLIILNCEHIFSLGLPSVRILIPAFADAVRRITPAMESSLRINIDLIDLRRVCYRLLCTMFSVCQHFGELSINQLTSGFSILRTGVPVNTIRTSGDNIGAIEMSSSQNFLSGNSNLINSKPDAPRILNSKISSQEIVTISEQTNVLQGLYNVNLDGIAVSSASESQSLGQVRFWIMDTLIASLIAERDTLNQRLLLSAIVAFSIDESTSTPGVIPLAANVLVQQLGTSRWTPEIAIVGAECLKQLARHADVPSSQQIYGSLISQICTFARLLVMGRPANGLTQITFRLVLQCFDSLLAWINVGGGIIFASDKTAQASVVQMVSAITTACGGNPYDLSRCSSLGPASGNTSPSNNSNQSGGSPPMPLGRSRMSTSRSSLLHLSPAYASSPLRSLESQVSLAAESILGRITASLANDHVNPFAPTNLYSTLLDEVTILSDIHMSPKNLCNRHTNGENAETNKNGKKNNKGLNKSTSFSRSQEFSSQSCNKTAGSKNKCQISDLKPELVRTLRYYVLNGTTILTMAEKPIAPGLSKGHPVGAETKELVLLFRAATGRTSWETSLVYSCENMVEPVCPKPTQRIANNASVFNASVLFADSPANQQKFLKTDPDLAKVPLFITGKQEILSNELLSNMERADLSEDEIAVEDWNTDDDYRQVINLKSIGNLIATQIQRCKQHAVTSGPALELYIAQPPKIVPAKEVPLSRLFLAHTGLSALRTISSSPFEGAIPLPASIELLTDLQALDSIPDRELITCAIHCEPSLIETQSIIDTAVRFDPLVDTSGPHYLQSNQKSSSLSLKERLSIDFCAFLQSLSWLTDRSKHTGFCGNYNKKNNQADECAPESSNGKCENEIIPYYADAEVELVFHLEQLLVHTIDNENAKVSLFPSSDLVAILWSREISVKALLQEASIRSPQAIVFICISPASDAASCGLYRVRIVPSPDLAAIPNQSDKANNTESKDFKPMFGPLLDGMVLRRESLGRLVRETVISAALFALYGIQGQMRPILRRSVFIHHLVSKYRQPQQSISNYYNEMI